VFFEGSMRTVFSMLFGAGVVLFTTSPGRDEGDSRRLWYRRTGLLVLFGLVDAWLLLWIGDILYVYGMTGLILYLFRDLPPTKLLACGVAALAFHASLNILQYPANVELFEQVQQARETPGPMRSDDQLDALERWEEFQQMNFEDEATNAQARVAYQGGWLDIFLFLAPVNLIIQTAGFLFGSLWDAGGMMLLGMALYKWRVFDASRSYGTYWAMVALGLPLGLAVNAWEVQQFIASGFSTHLNMSALRPSYDIGRLGTALGYIGLVMLACKAGLFQRLTAALASVGQMALTNYISHSVVCGFIFYGYGLGLSGQLERYQVYYIVLAIWMFQLISSPIWLRHFRFGPLEWLWRSLTYGKKQPLLRRQPGPVDSAKLPA
jgi:uncharacterized protein